jgi:alginate O-acetyltransferase complex protein AlgI
MLFNSLAFIILLIITFVLYYSPKVSKHQLSILILSSLFFYAYQEPWLLLLLLLSAGINITTSYYIVHKKAENKRTLATLGVSLNLLILAFFKYSPLVSSTFFSKDSSIATFLFNVPLPIGISFYTFEGISLLVDVYRNKGLDYKEVISKSFIEYAKSILFFIAFFPHLIAGPILIANDFLPQIKPKLFKDINWNKAFKAIIIGYFLKMVVADNLKDFTFYIEFPYFQGYGTFTLITMLLGYSCQIFADFAGYSLIAIGLAELFGYQLAQNFNFPYISTSFKEFWKRWHISLSKFLMEYLYFSLGGNKKGKVRTYINLMATMTLGGLWHGAAWSYAIWGAFHGSALAIERFISDHIKLQPSTLVLILKRIIVFSFITFAWLLFKLPNFNDVIAYIEAICINTAIEYDINICTYIMIYASPVFFYHFIYLYQKNKAILFILKYDYILYGFLLFLIITNSGASGDFIYFQF